MWPLITLPLVVTLLVANPVRLTRGVARDADDLDVRCIGVSDRRQRHRAARLLMNQLIAADVPIARAHACCCRHVGIWTRNILAFAVWFWELDRGRPGADAAPSTTTRPDFLFPQMQSPLGCAASRASPTRSATTCASSIDQLDGVSRPTGHACRSPAATKLPMGARGDHLVRDDRGGRRSRRRTSCADGAVSSRGWPSRA